MPAKVESAKRQPRLVLCYFITPLTHRFNEVDSQTQHQILLLPGEFQGKGSGTPTLQQQPQGPGGTGGEGKAQVPLLGDLQLMAGTTLLESLWNPSPP